MQIAGEAAEVALTTLLARRPRQTRREVCLHSTLVTSQPVPTPKNIPDERLRRMRPALIAASAGFLFACGVVAVVSDHAWDTSLFLWGFTLGLITAAWPDITWIVLQRLRRNQRPVPRQSTFRRKLGIVQSLVFGTGIGIVASALGAWVDGAATAMAILVLGGSLLAGIVLARRRDQPLDTSK